jgi:hypothetical protein
VWDIWSVPDAPLLRGYLEEHAHDFVHRGQHVDKAEVCVCLCVCVCVCLELGGLGLGPSYYAGPSQD